AVVDTEADRVEVRVKLTVGRIRPVWIEQWNGVGSKVGVQVLCLQRPILIERIFRARTDSPADRRIGTRCFESSLHSAFAGAAIRMQVGLAVTVTTNQVAGASDSKAACY